MKTSKEIISSSLVAAVDANMAVSRVHAIHFQAAHLIGNTVRMSGAFAHLLKAWGNYADVWQKANGKQGLGELDGYENISADGYIGPIWAKIGTELKDLLNGDIGELEGWRCDEVITKILESHGFDYEGNIRK